MFGGAYFGHRYFGVSFWGSGTASSVPLPVSLLAAIRADWTALGFLSSVGPLHLDEAPPRTIPPYAIVSIDRVGPVLWTNTAQRDEVRVCYRIRATQAADARARAYLVNGDGNQLSPSGFESRRFHWQTGYATRGLRPTWTEGKEVGITTLTGMPLHYVELAYRHKVKGNR